MAVIEMDAFERAILYVEENGDRVEKARLNILLGQRLPAEAVIAELQSSQRSDGGWNSFWATDYSSLDATCFYLAQAAQLAIGAGGPVFDDGLRFLVLHQKYDGSWEEDLSIAEVAPPWAKPGEVPATLYLTANCSYWLATSPTYQQTALKGACYLAGYVDESGQLPSFLHTHWLCAGLWLRMNLADDARRVLDYLLTRTVELSASQLTWMISALRNVGLPADHTLIQSALPTPHAGRIAARGWTLGERRWRTLRCTHHPRSVVCSETLWHNRS